MASTTGLDNRFSGSARLHSYQLRLAAAANPDPATRPACGRSAEPIGPSSRRRVKDGRKKYWPVRHGLRLPRWPWLGWLDEVDEKAGTPVCLLKVVGEETRSRRKEGRKSLGFRRAHSPLTRVTDSV